MKKKKIFSLTKKDFRWDFYKGSGSGGQKKNKTENCCRCTHEPSGAVGKSEEGRSKLQNQKKAFKRMAATPEFKKWIRIEASRITGKLAEIKKKIEYELQHNVKEEIKVDGKWKIKED